MESRVNSDILRIAETISQAIPAEKIYLFGSYAYGQPHKDSDYDFYVIIPDGSMRPIEAMQKAQRSLNKDRPTVAIDILAGTTSNFSRMRHLVNTIEKEVDQKGVLVYAR